jgi:hypothetical protein
MAFEVEIKMPGFAEAGTAGVTKGGGLLTGGLVGALVSGIKSAVDILGSIKKTMEKSSPYLGGVFAIMSRAMLIFFRPFGDFLGMLLRPMAIWMLRMAIKFYEWFKGLPETLKQLGVGLAVIGALAPILSGLKGLLGGAGVAAKGAEAALKLLPELGALGGLGGAIAKAAGLGFKWLRGALLISGIIDIFQAISALKEGDYTKALKEGLGAFGALLAFKGSPLGWAITGAIIFTDVITATGLDKKVAGILEDLRHPEIDTESVGYQLEDIRKKSAETGKSFEQLGWKPVTGTWGKLPEGWTAKEDISESEGIWKSFTGWIDDAYKSVKRLITGESPGLEPLAVFMTTTFVTATTTFNLNVKSSIDSLNSEKVAVDALTASYIKLASAKSGKSKKELLSYERGLENRAKYGLSNSMDISR